MEKGKINEICLNFLAKKKVQISSLIEIKITSLFRRLNFDFWPNINRQLDKLLYSQEDEMVETF
jgi:hypothetical protein